MSPAALAANPAFTAVPEVAVSAAAGPGLAQMPVLVGGLQVTYQDARDARELLAGSAGLMVRQPLARAGNPLADCDYHAAGLPYRGPFAAGAAAGRGAAGRHITKSAFLAALDAVCEQSCEDYRTARFGPQIEAAMSAFGSDHGYAAAIAAAAVALRRRRHAAPLRSWLRQSAHQALSLCDTEHGQFSCSNPSPCGTGGCRFAAGVLTQITAASPRGRQPRGANHTGNNGRAAMFSSDDALPQLERLVPLSFGCPVADADAGVSADSHV